MTVKSEHREIRSSDYPERPYISRELPVRFLKNRLVLPLGIEGGVLSVAMVDPDDVETIDALRLATGLDITVYRGKREEIIEAIERFYESPDTTVDEIVEGIGDEGASGEEEDVDHLRDMAQEAPIIRLVNVIITRAVEARASDIHIEPFEKDLRIRYRVDDILREVESLPKHLHAAVTSRVKIMANMDIAERRLPQDGRMRMRVAGRELDFRVATIPTSYGESVVLRILDRGSLVLNLEDLGLSPEGRLTFERMLSRPHGMILVTGPTGSGKTTTLYTALDKLNSPDRKIITIEDPVEYHLQGINQIQVKPQIGLTFASGLRHILRLDPNIIMVGEIRDRDTAEIAVQSALTGHLVFSTLHTNDSSGTIVRLLEMGVEDYLLASSLIGVVAQRLVRVICRRCRTPYEPDAGELLMLGAADNLSGKKFFKGMGCEECDHTGYRGRVGIFEILPVDGEIRRLILKNPESGTIQREAVKKGMTTLREDGLRKVFSGITTVDEIIRVTQEG